jgi:hypothetical protein
MLRAHLSDPVELTPPPKATPKPKPVWTPLRLNRNLMNYPLARSARTRPLWHEDKEHGGSWCRLPGEDRIELSVPAGAPVRRLPTGFDVNVLFRLLAGVQEGKRDHIKFASLAALLRGLHLTAHSENCARVLNSLELWAALTICYSNWYERGERGERNFPPPVRGVDFKGQSITVTLDGEWVKLATEKQYFAAVPLPLPQDSSAQNFALMTLTSMPTRVGQNREHLNGSDPIARRTFCRKIGLRNARAKLEGISAIVDRWFAARGGRAWLMEGGQGSNIKSGQVAFAFTPPAVPRVKKPTVKGSRSGPKPTVEGSRSGPKPTVEGSVYKKEKESKAKQ